MKITEILFILQLYVLWMKLHQIKIPESHFSGREVCAELQVHRVSWMIEMIYLVPVLHLVKLLHLFYAVIRLLHHDSVCQMMKICPFSEHLNIKEIDFKLLIG
ncbi:hypothetical protein X975_20765, partial [Stegodyphus mimosarum]